MRALVVDHRTSGHLRFADLPEPRPARDEALIGVSAFSINYGELHYVLPDAEPGTVPGWDAAGVVVRAAADGSGPSAGTPVVTLGAGGGWAQVRAVQTDRIGVVAPGADLGAISTLPVAATSALRALRRLGPILGRRVLVTGGGSVGRFAVQLAALGGAHVTAVARDPGTAATLRRLGADEVVTAVPDVRRPVHGVVDTAGGPRLVEAHQLLEPGGILVAVGQTGGQPEVFGPGSLVSGPAGHDRAIVGFYLFGTGGGLGTDMAWLAGLIATGRLDAQVGRRADWSDIGDVLAAVNAHRVAGKAVLTIS